LKLETKAEADRLSKITPKAHKYVMPEAQRKKLDANSHDLQKIIAAELAQEKPSEQDEYIVDAVADVSFGLENNFIQIVNDPEGMLVGGSWFPDAAGSEVVEYVHRFPALLKSATFADLYWKFLNAVAKWSKVTKNQYYVSPECVRDIQRELDGTYKLPEPKPKTPLPDREPQPPQPSIDTSGVKPGEQLAGDYSQFIGSGDSEMAREARQYLNHGVNRNRF
jgi:hypothetical protein